MDKYERAVMVGEYVINTKSTVRQTAVALGMAKSTVHNDIVRILPRCGSELYGQVKAILAHNKLVRSIRGGQATKAKYARLRMYGDENQTNFNFEEGANENENRQNIDGIGG